mmetsp:Transcript_11963/g.23732  ORF Transcript_11963/g.23732 Transcript_11963/m.23732 type:complete len:227 (-) Transcript_11963:152-832(-)
MLCEANGESSSEATLKRQALEKRLLTLEQETLQNNLLFEKFIRRLDDQFEITKGVDLTAIKNAAHFGAQSVSALLAEENAPPMPSFSELYSDPSTLNDALDGSMGGLDDQFGYRGDDRYGGGGGGGSGGKEPGSMELADDKVDMYGDPNKEWKDDFSGGSGAEKDDWKSNEAELTKDTVAEDIARPACNDWKAEYGVEPGVSWGSLPLDLQGKWQAYDCDTYVMSW